MSFGEAFFQLLIWVPLIMLWGFALWDLFHTSMNGVAKALWAIAIVFIPVIGVVLYFMLRHEPTTNAPASDADASSDDDDMLENLARVHDLSERGILDDAEYAKYKTYLVR